MTTSVEEAYDEQTFDNEEQEDLEELEPYYMTTSSSSSQKSKRKSKSKTKSSTEVGDSDEEEGVEEIIDIPPDYFLSGDFESSSVPAKQKEMACHFFDCNTRGIRAFDVNDPFNKGVSFGGYKCQREGIQGGSLFLTHMHGKLLCKPQPIFGVPKLRYPYTTKGFKNKKFETPDYKKAFGKHATQFFLSNKWNGSNIQFFKYFDEKFNKFRVSAKTKGSAQLSNSGYGQFLDLVKQCLDMFENGAKEIQKDMNSKVKEWLNPLFENENLQSISFEVCGKYEPHLVDYDFTIDLKPLFYIFNDGRIKPVMPNDNLIMKQTANSSVEKPLEYNGFPLFHGPFDYTRETMVNYCKGLQKRDLELNEEFRKNKKLKHKYEYFHFFTEGHVLYVLDEEGYVTPNRTLYKIKPRDIEEVHWMSFDDNKRELVRDAVKKMRQRGKALTEQNLRAELDMYGEKEWGKLGGPIMKFVKQEFSDWGTTPKTAKKSK